MNYHEFECAVLFTAEGAKEGYNRLKDEEKELYKKVMYRKAATGTGGSLVKVIVELEKEIERYREKIGALEKALQECVDIEEEPEIGVEGISVYITGSDIDKISNLEIYFKEENEDGNK